MPESSARPLADLHNDGLEVIIGYMVETANKVALEWRLALEAEETGNYDLAMTHLGNVTAQLLATPIQSADIQSAAEEAMDAMEKLTGSAE